MKTTFLKYTLFTFGLVLFSGLLMSVAKDNVEEKTFLTYEEVNIPAKEEFVLGEFGDKNFKAMIKNTGDKAVDVVVVDKLDRKLLMGFTLEPGAKASVYLSKYDKFIIQNHFHDEVSVEVKLNKFIQGFRYQQIRTYE